MNYKKCRVKKTYFTINNYQIEIQWKKKQNRKRQAPTLASAPVPHRHWRHCRRLRQRRRRVAQLDLREGDTVAATSWLGNPPPEPSAQKRRKPVGNTMPDIVSREPAETPDARLEFAPIVDAAEALVQHNAGTPHYSTWLVLFFLLVSDKLRRLVLRGTPAHVAEPYFEGFDQRISAYVCGVISYAPKGEEKRSKSGKVLSSAVSPIEAVASEWGVFETIVRAVQRT